METACQNIMNYFYTLTKIVPYRMHANDKNFNWSTSFNDSKTVSAINLILNGVDPLLTNTTNSYYNTNFSTFMAICAALQSPSCKASCYEKER